MFLVVRDREPRFLNALEVLRRVAKMAARGTAMQICENPQSGLSD